MCKIKFIQICFCRIFNNLKYYIQVIYPRVNLKKLRGAENLQ